jgi:8-oxo-dGTP pyrophosphatase MutT (NUDIX family)
MSKKISYGVVCLRKGNKGIEIIMVKKSTTYHFCEFVMGHYSKNNSNLLVKLFNNMTYHEKMDILSFNFDNMWYRVRREIPFSRFTDARSNIFYNFKNKFNTTFMNDTDRLKHLIDKSNNVDTPWEFPKGRKDFNDKSDIETAIREFKEETNIDETKFRMLWHIKPYVESYVDFGVFYCNVYYFAEAIGNWEPEIKFYDKQQISEISSVNWISKNNLSIMKLDETTHKRLLKLFNKIINKYRNNAKPKPILVDYAKMVDNDY